MSIVGIISEVTRNGDGTATLHLSPVKDDPVGQSRLTVVNPPKNLEAATGTLIWGGDSSIMVGQTRWADRLGYTKIRLRERQP